MKRIEIEKYISESEESLTPLIELLNTEGTHLVVAPPGAGKSNAIIESYKELGERNYNKVLYVMACPNKVQNLQNASKYNIMSVVAGTTERDLKGISVISMVYDKASMILDYAKKYGLEVVLTIDEGHQLVDSSTYRKKALQDLNNLKSYAKTTILLTATPRKIENLFEYDKQLKFVVKGNTNNFEKHTLLTFPADNSITYIANTLNNIVEKQGSKILMHIDSMEKIKTLKFALETKGKKVAVICSQAGYERLILREQQETEQIKTEIATNEMLPADYDVFLTTKILEVGTNLKNKNCTVIEYISNRVDFDSTTQFFYRTREKNINAYTFIVRKKENEEQKKTKRKKSLKIKSLKQYEIDIRKRVDKQFVIIKNILFNFHLAGLEKDEVNKEIKRLLNTRNVNWTKTDMGCIEFNEEKGVIVLNEHKLKKIIFNEYDKQFLLLDYALNTKLKSCVKADNYFIEEIQEDNENEEETQNIKDYTKKIEEQRKKEKELAFEFLKSFVEEGQLEELECFIKQNIVLDDNLKEKFELLKREGKYLKLLKDAISMQLDFNFIITTLLKNDKKSTFRKIIQQENYKARNKQPVDYELIEEYTIIRKHLDVCLKKQGRLTEKKLIKINEELVAKKVYSKLKENKLKKEENKGKEKKKIASGKTNDQFGNALPTRRLNALLSVINNIYNITKDNRISSLK